MVARDDGPLDFRRPPEHECRALHLAVAQQLPDPRGGDVLEQRDRTGLEPELAEQREVASTLAPEAEVGAGDDDVGADPPQVALGELLRLEGGEVERELDDERLLDPELGQELEPPLERWEVELYEPPPKVDLK